MLATVSYTKVKIERYFLKTRRVILKITRSIQGLFIVLNAFFMRNPNIAMTIWISKFYWKKSKKVKKKRARENMSSALNICVEIFIKGYTQASIYITIQWISGLATRECGSRLMWIPGLQIHLDFYTPLQLRVRQNLKQQLSCSYAQVTNVRE